MMTIPYMDAIYMIFSVLMSELELRDRTSRATTSTHYSQVAVPQQRQRTAWKCDLSRRAARMEFFLDPGAR